MLLFEYFLFSDIKQDMYFLTSNLEEDMLEDNTEMRAWFEFA